MITDDILRMAREADPFGDDGRLVSLAMLTPGTLERFAALVEAREREECAKVADAISNKYAYGHYGNEVDTADEIAAAIRARGKP